MSPFALNLVLTALWGAASGDFGFPNLALGFVLAAGVIATLSPVMGGQRYGLRLVRVAELAWLFLYELTLSNIRVARDVLRPSLRIHPGIVAVPIDLKSDAGITVLANLITLTPGTVTLDVSPDRKTLYVHALDANDPDRVRADLKSGFERKIREALE